MKPILFNTEMVIAILDGRKTVTRRVIKQQPTHPRFNNIGWLGFDDGHGYKMRQPYHPGDILYVRETWRIVDYLDKASLKFEYLADGKVSGFIDFTNLRLKKFLKYISSKKWCPSLFMPKEAARLFLRVTNVSVARLQDITEDEIIKEGLGREPLDEVGSDFFRGMFSDLWDSTIKKADLDEYGWDANPWVWEIEFERISKEEALKNG